MTERRKSIPANTRKTYLTDADTGHFILCGNCNLQPAEHIHHLKMVCEGGTDEPKNLICLCAGCHTKLHSDRGDFKRWGSTGGQKTAQSMKSFANLPQYRGEAGKKRLIAYMEKRADEMMGLIQ